jgi:hypothetical protein
MLDVHSETGQDPDSNAVPKRKKGLKDFANIFNRYSQSVKMIIMFQQGPPNIYGTTFPSYTPKLRYTVVILLLYNNPSTQKY